MKIQLFKIVIFTRKSTACSARNNCQKIYHPNTIYRKDINLVWYYTAGMLNDIYIYYFIVISGPSCCERRCKSHDPNPLLERFVGIYFVHAAQW